VRGGADGRDVPQKVPGEVSVTVWFGKVNPAEGTVVVGALLAGAVCGVAGLIRRSRRYGRYGTVESSRG